MHLARCEGWVEPGGPVDGVDDRAVLTHERINTEAIEGYHLDFGDNGGWVHLTGGVRRTDLPTFLVVSHLNAGEQGYAHTPPIKAQSLLAHPRTPA